MLVSYQVAQSLILQASINKLEVELTLFNTWDPFESYKTMSKYEGTFLRPSRLNKLNQVRSLSNKRYD